MLRCGLLLMLLAATAAHASPAAEKLFRDGKALMDRGKLDDACDAFRRSEELEPKVGTLLNWANCEEKRGHLATAWATFIEAGARAKREDANDPRIEEADKRAALLAPKLPYLTIKVAQPAAGLVVRRNGADVPGAELGHEVPLDPAHYEIEATVPGQPAWHKAIDLAPGAHLVVEVPAFATAPATSVPAASGPQPEQPEPPQPVVTPSLSRRFAVGAALGGSTDGDVIGGLRGVLTLAPAGPGAIRLVPSVFYTRFGDPNDVYQHFDLVAVGLAGEYVAPLAGAFAVAGGIGVGVDVIKDAYNNPLATHAWAAARVSPTYRLGPVDIGLHLQLVVGRAVVGLGELGVDYFF